MCVVGTSVELECDVVLRFSYFLFFELLRWLGWKRCGYGNKVKHRFKFVLILFCHILFFVHNNNVKSISFVLLF